MRVKGDANWKKCWVERHKPRLMSPLITDLNVAGKTTFSKIRKYPNELEIRISTTTTKKKNISKKHQP